jgi:predicted dehydrogenase
MARLKIGVVGCGAIAQVHHLPNLAELPELFEVTAVCDVSARAAEYVARRYHVPRWVDDYRELLAMDIDVALLCQSDPKTQVAVAALEAGKHLLVEKPMCFSLQEADRIIAARQRSGKVGMVGYMKVYDPAYEYARREVDAMNSIWFVQVNHLHPDNRLHVGQFRVERFDDVPAEAGEALQTARQAAYRQAIGAVPAHVERVFGLLSGSMIHDLYGIRVMVGAPSRVVNTEVWRDGRAVTVTLAHPNGARSVASWVDLPDLWDFRETLEVYGDDKRVLLSYPTGFARGILSKVVVQGVDERGTTYRKEPAIDWESAFKRELRHLHGCIVEGTPCRTPVESARGDIALIVQIVERYLAGGPSPR